MTPSWPSASENGVPRLERPFDSTVGGIERVHDSISGSDIKRVPAANRERHYTNSVDNARASIEFPIRGVTVGAFDTTETAMTLRSPY